MNRGPQGQFLLQRLSDESFRAYVPRSLPPKPSLRMNAGHELRAERASVALGRLDGLSRVLPDVLLFLYYYVRKEAVLSSQIEGTQSSLADLLRHERVGGDGAPADVHEVSNYVAAVEAGTAAIGAGAPITNRLIRELHAILLRRGRGSRSQPGEFRQSQNWVGGSRPGNAVYVPPPPHHVPECMAEFERFANEGAEELPALVSAALLHVQFETIHPFLDGNGRIGRILIVLYLLRRGVLSQPLLYPSLYLKRNRAEYYALLQTARLEGRWEDWLAFFYDGVSEAAAEACDTARLVLLLGHEHRARIQGMGRIASTALRVHDWLQRRPITTAPEIVANLAISHPTAIKMLETLAGAGLLEAAPRSRPKLFYYRDYLDALGRDTTEPL